MRTASLVLLLLAVLALAATPMPVFADSGSISRDALGPQPTGGNDPIAGTPTPRVYGLGQPLLFGAGVVLLLAAAALGVYTFMTARPIDA
jgi:hypothetical protein